MLLVQLIFLFFYLFANNLGWATHIGQVRWNALVLQVPLMLPVPEKTWKNGVPADKP